MRICGDAVIMMPRSGWNVKRTADECGFRDVFYLGRVFKQRSPDPARPVRAAHDPGSVTGWLHTPPPDRGFPQRLKLSQDKVAKKTLRSFGINPDGTRINPTRRKP